jgi:regulatory protein YycI of two-component signal transduction system YycFG
MALAIATNKEVSGRAMERTDHSEKDNAQKAKLIFFLLAAVVAVLLIWSFVSASKARSERDAARQDVERVKQDNIKLEQMVKDLNQENEILKKRVQQLDAKAKAKPAAKKKTKASKKKKPAKSTRND